MTEIQAMHILKALLIAKKTGVITDTIFMSGHLNNKTLFEYLEELIDDEELSDILAFSEEESAITYINQKLVSMFR